MRSIFIIRAVAVLLLWASNAFSQDEFLFHRSPDTLYYFNPDSIDLNLVYTGDIDSAGIFLTPNSSWKRYELLELQFLFVPGLVDSANPSFDGEISIRSSETTDHPGSLIAKVPIHVGGIHETYPNWKIISLQNISEVKNLQGNFWLEGNPLLACVISLSKSNHSYVHSANTAINWVTSLDIAVRAIVKRESPMRIPDKEVKDGDVTEAIIGNYPNPFYTSTFITIENFGLETRSSIKIYNVLGQIVKTVWDGNLETGIHRFVWNGIEDTGTNVPSGLYFCHVVLGERSVSRKIIIVR